MRISIFVLITFFVWGRLQSDVQAIKIKTVLKTIKKSPAVLKVVKKIQKLPKKLPKKTLTRLQKLDLGLTPESINLALCVEISYMSDSILL